MGYSVLLSNYRRYFTGQVISQVGNWLTLVAQTLLVLHLTDSGIALGVLAAAQFGPILVLGPFAGLVADRSDKRRLLLIVQTIAMVQSFALAALAFSGGPSVVAIYAIAFVGGVTMAFDNPARRSFVVEMVGENEINNAVSLNSAIMTSSRIVGPALAGLLEVRGLGILRLVRGYGPERLEAACQRGMDIGARSYGSVQSILRNGLDRAYRPEPVPDELPLEHGNIRGSGYYH